MRIGIGIGGEVINTPTAPEQAAGEAYAAELAGFPAAWTVWPAAGAP